MDNKVIKPQNSFIYEIECNLIEGDERFVIKGSLDKEEINNLIFYPQITDEEFTIIDNMYKKSGDTVNTMNKIKKDTRKNRNN